MANDTETRIFSTGLLEIGDIGAADADLVAIGDLQDIEVTVSFQEKEMRAANWINQFAQARSFFGGKAEIKATAGDLSKELLKRCIGGVASPDGKTIRIGKLSKPTFFKVKITTEDPETGEQVLIYAYRFSAPNLTAAFKLDDYVMPNFNGQADPSREAAPLEGAVIDYVYPS